MRSTCIVCSREFSQNDMICLENRWICAECKPAFVQKLQEGATVADLTIARSKKSLVMGRKATLPDRCVKCNGPANANRLRRDLYWHNPALYLLILISILVYAIVAIAVRKQARIAVPLCDTHLAKRKKAILITWLIVVAAIVLLFAGISTEIGPIMALAGLLFLGGIIYGAIATQTVTARKIDKEYVWLNGVCKEYLAELPEWVKPK